MRKTPVEISQDSIDVAKKNWNAYLRGHNAGHEDYVTEAKKFDKFYMGDQWSDSDIKSLESSGRPHLTINLILKIVNAFLGEQKKNRADLTFRPFRDATSDMAVLMSKLVEQILENNNFEFLEREVFSDGIIQDRGYFDVRINFDDNIFGDVEISALDPFEIIPDPDSKSYDPEDWNEVIKTSWVTLDDIEVAYGRDKREEVESYVRTEANSLSSDSVRFDATRTFGDEEGFSPSISDVDGDTATIRAVRLIERQHRELTMCSYFVDAEAGDMSLIPHDMTPERAQELADANGLLVYEKLKKRIRWTVTTSNTVLHDEWSPYESLTIVPYFPYFRKGKASGIVRQLISPQEQHNKYESQMLHVVNTSANSGWLIQAGSLIDMNKDELAAKGAETGLVLEYARNATPPQKIQPNNVPSGLDRIAERTRMSVSDIAGLDPFVGDTQENTVGGNVVSRVQTRNMVQVQVPFDSLNLTRKLVGRKVLELVQDFYSEPRIFRVTNSEDMRDPTEDIMLNVVGPAGELINNTSVGKYDLMVTTRPARDTFQSAQFAEGLEMRAAGVMVPDDVIIRNSTLENKDKIADRVASLTGQAPMSDEQAQQQQALAELEMQSMQLDLQKTQAEVQEIQSRAQEQFAKGAYLIGREQREAVEMGMQYNSKLTDMRQKMTMQSNELQNKIELAKIHSSSKRADSMYGTMSKSATEEIKNRTMLDVARINAGSLSDKNKPSTVS
tara:strand:- start:339 stop:2525 length:2187 start_codon:yes stop_codon:yes gene_type:complete